MRSTDRQRYRGTSLDGGSTGDAKGWYQQLKEWWAARKAARQRAKLVALTNRWDAEHEAVKPLRADAAIEMAIAQGTLSLATQPYSLIQDSTSGGPLGAGVRLDVTTRRRLEVTCFARDGAQTVFSGALQRHPAHL